MLGRIQLRRHLLFKYDAKRQHSQRNRNPQSVGEGPRQRLGVFLSDRPIGTISLAQRLRNWLAHRAFEGELSSQQFCSVPKCPSIKSLTTGIAPDVASIQDNEGRMLTRCLQSASFSSSHNGPEKVVANDRTSTVPSALSWQNIYFSVGAISAAIVLLVSAVGTMSYTEDTTSRTKGVLLSTCSILWGALASVGKKIGALVSDTAEEVVDAGTSTSTLVRCLVAVLMTGREGTVGMSGSWLKPRVTALVADLAAHEHRRRAVVEAAGGQVVDWLLIAAAGIGCGVCNITQAEAARALAYLLSDENTCEDVLSRPHALPYLFQFASSLRVEQDWSKGQLVHASSENFRGKSMLVTAIMDLITSSCEAGDTNRVRPKLAENGDPEDIAAALKVVKDGGWSFDDQSSKEGGSSEKGDGDKGGVHGIGIRVLGGTGLVGIQRVQLSSSVVNTVQSDLITLGKDSWEPERLLVEPHVSSSQPSRHNWPRQDWRDQRLGSAERSRVKYGLWDDLQGRHITVPLAAWALATWAEASSSNRAKILEIDEDGEALLSAVMAPERTVKWHGATAMRLLLGSKNYTLTDIAPHWSPALLGVAAQAGGVKDYPLCHCALGALTACVSRSKPAHNLVLETGLPAMREIAYEAEASTHVQAALAQALDVLTAEGDVFPVEESKKWSAILLRWVCNKTSEDVTRSCGSKVLVRVINNLGQGGIPVSQAWLAMLLVEAVSDGKKGSAKANRRQGQVSPQAKEREQVQNQLTQVAIAAASQLAKLVAQEAAYRTDVSRVEGEVAESAAELPMIDLLGLDVMGNGSSTTTTKESLPKVTAVEAGGAVRKAIKSLAELTAEEPIWRQRILDAGALCLLRRFMLGNDYEQWAASETSETSAEIAQGQENSAEVAAIKSRESMVTQKVPHIRKHAARLLTVLTLQPAASDLISGDQAWFTWLENCADGKVVGCTDNKTRSYALAALLNVSQAQLFLRNSKVQSGSSDATGRTNTGKNVMEDFWPRYEDNIFLMNPGSDIWKTKLLANHDEKAAGGALDVGKVQRSADNSCQANPPSPGVGFPVVGNGHSTKSEVKDVPVLDVVFVHGLRGGPFKTWRVSDNKVSTTTPLVEKIDEEAGRQGTCWPQEWLAEDLPRSRLLTIKYKTNLSEWSGATLPLQEVSSMLLDKLLAAGVGERPLVFVTHSMGGLVVKQMLLQAERDETRAHLLNQTTGIIFYSCPHFGSKLADMPWRIGLVLRPAPTIGELRSGSPRLEELNQCLRHLHKEGHLDVLSFSETKVTPLVEGYGGWGLRLEVVPIESAYPGFGELVVLPGTDHVNSCKPLDRTDPAYTKTVEFLQNQELYAERLVSVSQD